MKRPSSLATTLGVLVLVVALAGSAGAAVRRIAIATAGTGGALYPMGVAMAESINRHVPGFQASAQASAASVQNLSMLHAGSVEWGIAQSEIAWFAYNGLEVYRGRQMDHLRALFATVGSWVQVFVPANSPVRSFDDLRGKRVGVGSPGSGGEVDARMLLGYFGLTYQNVKAVFLSDAEMVEALKEGTLDAMVVTHPLKSAPLLDLTTSMKVRMLSVDDPSFYRKHPYFLRRVIPGGTYEGIDEPVVTPYSRVVMYTTTRSGLGDDDIYRMLQAIWDNRNEWKDAHPAVSRDVTWEAALDGIATPLHPGAVRFFRDRGVKVPDALIPPEMK